MNVAVLMVLAYVFAACAGGETAGPSSSRGAVPKGSGGAPESQVLGCKSDRECSAGEGCADGLCLPFAREGLTFSIVVVPPADSGLIPDQFTGVSVQAGGAMDLTLTRPVEVRGIVGFAPDATTPAADAIALETVGGLLVASAPGLIPGTQFRSEASVQGQQKGGEEWTFVLRLLPGILYSTTFIPATEPARGVLAQLPTFSFTAQFAKSESGFRVVLPSRKEYEDSIIRGVVFLDETGTQPVRGAKVTTVAPGMKGTSAITDEQGVFQIVAPPGTLALTLRIEPGKGSLVFPVRDFLYPGGAAELSTGATPRFVVGPVPPVRDILLQVFSVSGQVLSPVSQARVEAEGQAGGGLASGYAMTGPDGVARLSLLEGVYALAVIPPEGSPYAARVNTLDLEASKDTNVFHVPLSPRVKVSGLVVRDRDGMPVPKAVVTLQSDRITAFEGTSFSSMEFTVSAVSDADGSFNVLLDPGIYAFTAIPPQASGLARFGQPEVDLTGGDAAVTVRLVEGALVRGRVLAGGSGEPVFGAQVQTFFEILNGAVRPAFVGTSYASSIQTVGSAVTGADGRFSVVVPDFGAEGLGGQYGEDLPGGDAQGFGLPAVEVIPSP